MAHREPAAAGGRAHGHDGSREANHRGRPASWVAILTIIAGFLVGGLGLVLGPTWWLFWAGVGIAAVGGILALVVDVFADVDVVEGVGEPHVTRHEARHAADRPGEQTPRA